MSVDEAFAKVVGRQASEEERARLYRLRATLGLADNDAFWPWSATTRLPALPHADRRADRPVHRKRPRHVRGGGGQGSRPRAAHPLREGRGSSGEQHPAAPYGLRVRFGGSPADHDNPPGHGHPGVQRVHREPAIVDSTKRRGDRVHLRRLPQDRRNLERAGGGHAVLGLRQQFPDDLADRQRNGAGVRVRPGRVAHRSGRAHTDT